MVVPLPGRLRRAALGVGVIGASSKRTHGRSLRAVHATDRISVPEHAHALVAPALREGSFAVDATAGRGRDTLFLARAVGESGRVLALDVQPEALASTAALLRQHGLEQRVELVLADHARLDEILQRRRPDGVLFNLGFLPGAARAIETRPESTLLALEHALGSLAPGGRLVVAAYTGHRGGRAEAAAVLRFARRAGGRLHRTESTRHRHAPRLLYFEDGSAR